MFSHKAKRIYFLNEGSQHDKDILGVKGANLCELSRIGMPVPPAFTIAAQTCKHYQHEKKLPPELVEQITAAVHRLEGETGKKFGITPNTPNAPPEPLFPGAP
mmetsp:Transcript_17555/g.38934  ORF Transcript_17555/g.38934 Transcript_17555/m.38934 type:complete len:103 (+) Transcript_17555:382-690(+)